MLCDLQQIWWWWWVVRARDEKAKISRPVKTCWMPCLLVQLAQTATKVKSSWKSAQSAQ